MAATNGCAEGSSAVSFFRVLADDTRLAILRLLTPGDLRAGEVVERLGLPANSISYHLRQLRSVGLLRDRRSSVDARDVYYSLDLDKLHQLYSSAGGEVHPGISPRSDQGSVPAEQNRPLRVLFLCTHNSARSQLAEGIMRHLAGDAVEVYSAGSEVSEVHPLTIQLLREWAIDTTLHYSKTMDRFLGEKFDYVITTCDRARESCPVFPGDPRRIHWSFPDPKAVQDPEEQLRAFQKTRAELCTRIRYLLNLPHPETGRSVVVQPHDVSMGRA